jgi:serpin B
MVPLVTLSISIVTVLVVSLIFKQELNLNSPIPTPVPLISHTPSPSNTPTAIPDNPITTEVSSDLARAHNSFGISLFKKLYADNPNRNTVISPLSLSLAFTMLYNGAEGETLSALQNGLFYSDDLAVSINPSTRDLTRSLATNDVTLDIANSIWTKPELSVSELFILDNQRYLDAEVRQLLSADEVNQWVSDKTNEKIDTIISPPLPDSLLMMLINAIYFNGTWQYEFDKSKTYEEVFTTLDGPVQHQFMPQTRDDFYYLENTLFKAVLIPYGQETRYGMYVIVPKNSLSEVVSALNTNDFTTWSDSFYSKKGYVGVPKFTIEFDEELSSELSELGLGIIFSDQADFGKISSQVDLKVDFVKHKTFIEVDERGTEAAAVTSIEMPGGLFQNDDRFSLIVNKPFLFIIADTTTREMIFVGSITNPQGE